MLLFRLYKVTTKTGAYFALYKVTIKTDASFQVLYIDDIGMSGLSTIRSLNITRVLIEQTSGVWPTVYTKFTAV